MIRVLLALFLVVGCTHTNSYRLDPEFNTRNLREQGLLIGGVVSYADVDFYELTTYARILELAVRDRRSDVQVHATSNTVTALGRELHLDALDEFRNTKQLPSDFLMEIASSLGPRYRYIVYGMIENEFVSRSSEQRELGNRQAFLYRADRTMTVYFTVFDLQELKPVWAGAFSSTKFAVNQYDRDAEKTVAGDILADFGILLKSHYPAPPSQRLLLENISTKFASNLPQDSWWF